VERIFESIDKGRGLGGTGGSGKSGERSKGGQEGRGFVRRLNIYAIYNMSKGRSHRPLGIGSESSEVRFDLD
jgi:hypothetical protein